MSNVLLITASGRHEGSVSRPLAEALTARIGGADATIVERDLAKGLPFVDAAWIEANNTPAEDRTDYHKGVLALSDSLVDELKAADAIVLATPIYNFGAPAVLKAWIDMICRARLTFRYGENGPVGLLEDRPVYVVVSSGGTAVGSEIDYLTAHLRHVFGFIGIQSVEFIAADQLMRDADGALARANAAINALPALQVAV